MPQERVYALTRCADGRWLLLNRRYKPYGVRWPRERWADYDACDGVRLSLTPKQLRQIEGGNVPYREGDEMVWLFSDGTDPGLSAWTRHVYAQRVALLGLKDQEAA